jgi:tryptophan-rich sensory protein
MTPTDPPTVAPKHRTSAMPPSDSPFARRHLPPTAAAIALSVFSPYGGSLPNDTRSEWFRLLNRPDVLPRELERLIPFIWLGLFLLGGIGLAAVWSSGRPPRWKWGVCGLLALQLGLNYGYSYTFTMLRDIPTAFWLAVALAAVTAAVIAVVARGRVWLTAACFLPYLLWVLFATEVTRRLAALNPSGGIP